MTKILGFILCFQIVCASDLCAGTGCSVGKSTGSASNVRYGWVSELMPSGLMYVQLFENGGQRSAKFGQVVPGYNGQPYATFGFFRNVLVRVQMSDGNIVRAETVKVSSIATMSEHDPGGFPESVFLHLNSPIMPVDLQLKTLSSEVFTRWLKLLEDANLLVASQQTTGQSLIWINLRSRRDQIQFFEMLPQLAGLPLTKTIDLDDFVL